MKHNRVMMYARDLFFRKRRKGRLFGAALLGVAAALYMTCAWILPTIIAPPESRRPLTLEWMGPTDSYQVEIGGFLMTFQVEEPGGPKMEDEEGVSKPAGSIRALSVQSREAVPESNPSQEPQVELHVEEVTEGEYYDELMAAIDGDGLIAPPQVIELTASIDGKKVDMSGLTITIQADPNRVLAAAANAVAASLGEDGGEVGKAGIVVTVQPLGGTPATRVFTSEELESGNLSPVAVTYTVPADTPAMYALSVRATNDGDTVLGADETWTEQKVITKDTTIDLNGHTITCGENFTCEENPFDRKENGTFGDFDPSIFQVMPGVTLTIMDSAGGGAITTTEGGPGTLITLSVWQPCEDKTGTINRAC